MIVSSYWPSQAPYPEQPLPDILVNSAETFGEKIALVSADGSTRTYARVLSDARKVARLLQDNGVQKGDKVGIFSPNHIEYPAVFYGSLLAGATVTTLNPLYTAHEIATQLGDAQAVVLFAFTPMAAAVEEARKSLPLLRKVFPIDDLPSVLEGVPEDFRQVAIDVHEDIAALPYSSGTTGLPKGVMLTHFNIFANVTQGLATRFFNSDMVGLWTLPLFHIYGMTVLMSASLARGGTGVVMARFDVEQMLQLIQQHRITDLYLAPPAILAMVNAHPERYDTSSLQVISSGAAPLPLEIGERAKTLFKCIVSQGYGMTETSPTINTNPFERIKLESVGPPSPDTLEKIVSPDTGDELPVGEVGELMVKGPQVMKGYWNNPKETADCLTSDGWLRTGDIGRFDEDGYLYLIERKKEMIKYKGYQVAPAELEALLHQHPAVLDAAVIPKPDEAGGEIPKACVVLRPEKQASAEELMTFIAGKVAPYKKIREVEFMDAIPKTLSGKILRRDLIQREKERLAK
ncbi:MAG: AMP-binding protein [Dehalococcoidia bacterium]|jgi:acyl-CoA synthetase (AMP-forming)/AMP-acid ligase II